MADQCIVCLENLDIAASPPDSSPGGLEDPTSGVEDGGGSFFRAPEAPVAGAFSSTNTTNSADDASPGMMNNDTKIAVIEVCGHTLHNSCLLEWASKANSCPICRQAFHLVNVFDRVGGNLLTTYKVEDKKQVAEFDPRAWLEENPEEEEEEEPVPCPICGSAGDEDLLLLCDGCDACYHTYCVGLDDVPDDAWFCMECAPVFYEVHVNDRPRGRTVVSTANGRIANDFFPRTRASMRRARRRARSDDWQGAWGEITGRIFDALDIDLDSHDGDDDLEGLQRSRQIRERHQRDYQRWQQRLNIARRLGAQDVFARSIPSVLLQPTPSGLQRAVSPTPQSLEERRAWATMEKARECNGEGPSHRKRKSRSVTASPAEPPPEPERRLKRPRTRRVMPVPSEASSSKSPSRAAGERKGPGSNTAMSPMTHEDVPSFLSSLLKEVEQSTGVSDDEAVRSLLGDNRAFADPSSPGSSPSASAYNSPRALSLTPPPPQQQPPRGTRPTSPMSLSSHIEPIYPPANYLSSRSAAGDTSDSETRTSNQGVSELRQPRPRRSQEVRLPRSPEVSPARMPLPLEMKESISSIVRSALKPHWKSNKLTSEQYANINRDVSRKLYDEVSDPATVNEDARRMWEKVATQEVARAISGLQA